ncbi:hypothetical protein ATANTOWER_031303 [Ataeniobius toweri]|uniref:Uncharacterized protein n=1 Tax=Ataeniobius toweri TaxID=208326 RepID=A0ABU7AC73_9TELE|nr:hypothetical protein [Ataeniobius toweri]
MSVSRPLTPTVPGASAFLCSGKATLNSCPSFWACCDIQRAATKEVNNLPWLTKPKKRSSERTQPLLLSLQTNCWVATKGICARG